jgi:tetratricopeptide (TPR) repeat protein
MADMTGIASMLAQGGAQIGQQIGAPIAAFGQGLGGMLTARKEKQREEEKAKEIQNLLQQNAGDAKALENLAQGYEVRGEDALAETFRRAALAAKAQTTQTTIAGAVAGMQANDPNVLFQAGRDLINQGNIEQGLAMIQKADAMIKDQQSAQAMNSRKTILASRAKDLGLEGIAESVMATNDPAVLKEIAKDIRAQELKGVPTKSSAVRRRIAQTSGIDTKTFDELDLANVSDDEFDSIILGEKGDVKSWMTADGQIAAFRVNESGLVYDETDQKWKQPGEIGLTQAPPQVQKVEQIASEMGTELAKVGAKNFTDLQDKAVKAAETIRSIDESFPMIDDMFTGALANVKLNVSRYAKAFGIDLGDLEGITNTETYAAMAATRVADYITNLGAGTGLSDADREFAQAVVAGNVTADASSLKRILTSLRDGAVNKINKYNKVREDVRSGLGEGQKGVLNFFPAVQVPEGGVKKVNWGEL